MNRADVRLSIVSPRPKAADGAAFASRTDDELMLLTRGGVKDAFGALVRRHQRRVLRLAAHRLGGSSLAADVAQGTFLDIHIPIRKDEAEVPLAERVQQDFAPGPAIIRSVLRRHPLHVREVEALLRKQAEASSLPLPDAAEQRVSVRAGP